MKLVSKFFTASLAVALSSIAYAQTPATAKSDSAAARSSAEAAAARPNPDTFPVRTFYLTNTSQQNNANEIVTALRYALPSDDRVFLVYNQDAIVTRASADDDALVQKLLNDLDRPSKTYRLIYTVSEMDGSKLVSTQHYAMVLASGQQTVLKQGSKIPIATGSYSSGAASGTTPGTGVQTQFTYVDVGMNFDATLTEMGENAMLKTDVADTSVAPEKSVTEGGSEPIIRQTELKGESLLAPGKTLVLGSLDIPGSTSHLDIAVVMQPLP